jgi:hypothetical protein
LRGARIETQKYWPPAVGNLATMSEKVVKLLGVDTNMEPISAMLAYTNPRPTEPIT